MQVSQFLLATLKETPADAELASHQLMLRAGMIRKLASGVYTWLPLGVRVLNKVIEIIREEMVSIGGLECIMPTIQPAELWQKTGRWEKYGPELLKITDRHEREFCYAPTAEDVVTAVMQNELKSYKQLPKLVFQFQTKFRDEIRPRFGVMRSREFLMKDAYSFHMDEKSLQTTYDAMYAAYQRVFDRLGLRYRPVQAATGSIGGDYSHEFQVLADSGEDCIVYSDTSHYAANLERAESLPPEGKRSAPTHALEKVSTPGVKTIDSLTVALNVPAAQTVKTLMVKSEAGGLIALVIRGDHSLNEVKAEKCPEVLSPLTLATEEDIQSSLELTPGYIGPVGLQCPMIVDYAAAALSSFVCGANEEDSHYRHVSWDRDCQLETVADLRNVVEGDPSPDGQGHLKFARGIEVGQIFQLGDLYSHTMQASVLDENGRAIHPLMGCYGIGVTRVIAAAIEQHHDERGILWPDSMAPFQVALVPLNYQKSYRVKEAADELYNTLIAQGIDVLFDDRKERPGVKFSDMDLIGIPHRLVVTEKGLDQSQIEYKFRSAESAEIWALDSVHKMLKERMKSNS